jgi:murein DD-endopeptidase MepM/ murein hydrolase activator NlpD
MRRWLRSSAERLNRSRRFNILIVPNDGSRPYRLNVAQAILPAILVPLACAILIGAVMIGDYVRTRAVARSAGALQARLTEQQQTAETVRSHVGEIMAEIGAWHDLHARIWEPFGPEVGPAHPTRGVGGPRADSLAGPPRPRASAIEELAVLADTIKEEGRRLRALERVMARAGRAIATLPSRWPVRGAVNSEFGKRNSPWTSGTEFHGGIDIAAGRGTPVRAPAPGTVVAAGSMGEYGIAVIIEHSAGLRTIYGHLSKLQVARGQQIERGQVLALSGSTGKSTAPHLHYEILVKGHSVNPRAYLWD